MSKELSVPVLVLLLLAAADGLTAQNATTLTVTVMPQPERVEIGRSKLTFSARAPRRGLNLKTGTMSQANYRVSVRCGEHQCYSSEPVVTPEGSSEFVTIAFNGTFSVPSNVAAGTQICAALEAGGFSAWSGKYGYSEMTHVCRTALNPPVIASGSRAPMAVSGVTPAIPRGGSAQAGARPPAQATARASGSALRVPLQQRPDLQLTYDAAPVARWLVRNVGVSMSPATSLKFARAGVSPRLVPVPKIAPGSWAEFVVTPELDQYLVNSTAMVDPEKQVIELSETNNEWKSATSR